MDNKTYRVIFRGEIVEGKLIEDVKKQLALMLKKDAEAIEQLFSGHKLSIKKNASLKQCKNIQTVFNRAGAICIIEEERKKNNKPGKNLSSIDNANFPPSHATQPPPLPKQPDVTAEKRVKRPDEKFCESCGQIIKMNVLACPYCGKKIKKSGSMPGCAIAAIVFVVFIFIAGILAAIAIPQFAAYRNRAYTMSVKAELQEIAQLENEYFLIHKKYTSDLTDLNFTIEDPKVVIEILSADENCFEAKGTRIGLRKEFWIDCHGNERESEKTTYE